MSYDYINIPERTENDLNSSADINKLMENIKALGGNSGEAPDKTIQTLKTDVDDIYQELQHKPGQIIESLSSPCDGSSIELQSGTYTVQEVTESQTTTNSYADLSGSVISYKPPEGTKRIDYKFTFASRRGNARGIGHYKIFVDDNEILYARRNFDKHTEQLDTIEWTFKIGGVGDDFNVGRFENWNEPKTIKIMVRQHSDSHPKVFHETRLWDGGAASHLSMPHISLKAIA